MFLPLDFVDAMKCRSSSYIRSRGVNRYIIKLHYYYDYEITLSLINLTLSNSILKMLICSSRTNHFFYL